MTGNKVFATRRCRVYKRSRRLLRENPNRVRQTDHRTVRPLHARQSGVDYWQKIFSDGPHKTMGHRGLRWAARPDYPTITRPDRPGMHCKTSFVPVEKFFILSSNVPKFGRDV
jgi:hypothetical protein